MKIDGNLQIPNVIVYTALYAVVFGISIWLLVFHPGSPAEWFLYAAMFVLTVGGLAKFVHSRRGKTQFS